MGIRPGMLIYLYWRRVRAHPVAELLAGAGVAIGVALAFGVLVANTSLTSSADRLVRGLVGSARFVLVARSAQGFDQRLGQQVGELPEVQIASPVLRQNVTLAGPRGERAVQLIGVTPSLEALGGLVSEQLAAGSLLLEGGIGLPDGVAKAIGAHPGAALELAGDGRVRSVRMRAMLADSSTSLAASPVAVAVLGVAQRLADRPGRISELMIRSIPGRQGPVARELARFAQANHLDLRPADGELRLLSMATRPNRQSTALFTAIAVMIGFLLALNAVLLTVPERRRFIADLRLQGYGPGHIALLLGFQALVLAVLASLVGILAGQALASALFQRTPGFLTAAFPLGSEQTVHAGTVAIALACGVLAALIASLSPLADLRAGRSADAPLRHRGTHSEAVGGHAAGAIALVGLTMAAAATGLTLLASRLTIAAGVSLAVASVCVIPGALWLLARALPRALEWVRSGSLIVALSEVRVTTLRSVALAAIAGLAVYGGTAIGGARNDLLRGIGRATDQYFGTAQIWVTAGRDVFNTNAFSPAGPVSVLRRLRKVASVRIYRGGLLDVGERRMWLRARPPGDGALLESSQLVQGSLSQATWLIDRGGWAAVSSDYASERHLSLGKFLTLPTPSGPARFGVAAILSNSGWPAGTLTIGAADYRRLWRTDQAAALEVDFKTGVNAADARRMTAAALEAYPGLQTRTAAQRDVLSAASARQGLRTLGDISTLLLLTAALSVASALSAAIWQRRPRLASLKMHGYDNGQLWRAVLLESSLTLGVGAAVGAMVGVAGHALASRFLQRSTGFPAPFALGPVQVLLTIALFAAIALAVIALPGLAAARVSPRAVLQE